MTALLRSGKVLRFDRNTFFNCEGIETIIGFLVESVCSAKFHTRGNFSKSGLLDRDIFRVVRKPFLNILLHRDARTGDYARLSFSTDDSFPRQVCKVSNHSRIPVNHFLFSLLTALWSGAVLRVRSKCLFGYSFLFVLTVLWRGWSHSLNNARVLHFRFRLYRFLPALPNLKVPVVAEVKMVV